MGLRFIDLPGPATPSQYEEAVDHLVERIRKLPGVVGIIRFGSLAAPGISDIDLLVVFEDKVQCAESPLDRFPASHTHLLSHGVDAMSWSFYQKTPDLTFWFNSKCIWGDNERLRLTPHRSEEEERALKVQTAVEYIITNYIDLTLQLSYGIIKLRAMMQHLKGLAYDLEFLGIHSGGIYDAIMELRAWMAAWQDTRPHMHQLAEWIHSFYDDFSVFAGQITEQHPVYAPERKQYTYTRNVVIEPASRLGFDRKGLRLPNAFSFLGKRYYNLQHRLNSWTFYLPMVHQGPEIIESRFAYFKSMKAYNQVHFPSFSHLTTGFSEKFD